MISFKGKISKNFPFPSKVKNSKITDYFPPREKVEKIPSFSQGRKMIPPKGGNINIFPDGQRGKERWALSAAHPPSFPCPLTKEIF